MMASTPQPHRSAYSRAYSKLSSCVRRTYRSPWRGHPSKLLSLMNSPASSGSVLFGPENFLVTEVTEEREATQLLFTESRSASTSTWHASTALHAMGLDAECLHVARHLSHFQLQTCCQFTVKERNGVS